MVSVDVKHHVYLLKVIYLIYLFYILFVPNMSAEYPRTLSPTSSEPHFVICPKCVSPAPENIKPHSIINLIFFICSKYVTPTPENIKPHIIISLIL